ncbi:MAG: TIM barrel protein [Pseudomonadota bacterium]
MRFSANLGFLWIDRPLTDRIRAAKAAGFDAVECHFPYEHPAEEIAAVLKETDLRMLGINTALGPKGCFGLAALPGRESEARALIDQAIAYATEIKARHINTVAGLTGGAADAEQTYRENLAYACQQAAENGLMIVIEPLNPRAVASYHCWRLDQAVETIKAVGAPNLKIMYDFFHMQIVHGDLEAMIRENIDMIGHVQFAAIHDRGEPDVGEINFAYVFNVLEEAGYDGHLGAEYKPRGETVEAGLGWMDAYKGN